MLLTGLNEADKKFSITFSTFAPSPIEVTFIAKEFKDYYIKEGVNYTVKVSPSEPSYYYFSFFANKIAHENIFINIDSNDDQCVVVSLQKSLVSNFLFKHLPKLLLNFF